MTVTDLQIPVAMAYSSGQPFGLTFGNTFGLYQLYTVLSCIVTNGRKVIPGPEKTTSLLLHLDTIINIYFLF